MNRRDFIALTASVTLVAPMAARAAQSNIAYSPDALQTALAEGQTVFLDFKASWCTTCAAQERVINALRSTDPAYDKAITFMDVDWDQWKGSQIVKDLSVPRRSTLILLRGNNELGRIVAGTSRDQIKELLDLGLHA
ncbi:thioredoxin family protein [Paracoccus sp. Z330]|uniref:Thioredoxin family protein n=1 Tax=Paracoccus onchidii TaxID=3017813 RepID=A0ABT4ZJ75_9RHOB|nr:thioredoxin family protein [Paracoccus onchidii]MDB6179376.1 thioredoxin family protein [Paracoccus onchidii]